MIGQIQKVFKERKAGVIGKYKKSAVMILLAEENNKTYIIFEVRSRNLKNQPGDVCLPGGRIEPFERADEAALRETVEELGVYPEDISYIGEMDRFVSPYGSIMYPFISELKNVEMRPNKSEVEKVFKVPLDFFMKNEPLTHEIGIIPEIKEGFPYNLIKGGKNYKFGRGKFPEYFYKYDKYVIWGFTALIIKSFIDIIKQEV